ncbi:hypothetical protein ACHAXR_000207, partial [Thalassiosira sp. AJA248-18]
MKIMGNPKSNGNNPSLDPLHQTIKSLKDIRTNLTPFLRLLKDDDGIRKQRPDQHAASSESATSKTNNMSSKKKRSRRDHDESESNNKRPAKKSQLNPHRRAEAEAAVALAVGTLRYMGARLRGLDQGRKKGDPLRAELDKIRGMLVALRKLENDNKNADDGEKKGSLSKKKAGGVEQNSKSVNVTGAKDTGGSNAAKRRKGVETNSGIDK